MNRLFRLILWIVIIAVLLAGLWLWIAPRFNVRPAGTPSELRDQRVLSWILSEDRNPEWAVHAGERCADAPFQMPTDGFIGYLWDDSFRPGHRHTGLDIFGGAESGETPVYAAADGYLTRLPEWKSSLIMRLPDDPLQPGRQIWLYYTHLADPFGRSHIDAAFPPGTEDVYVPAGTLLGYQGNYSGTPGAPVGVHLHFSIVRDNGAGRFLSELEIENTLDPSPYLGLDVNAHSNLDQIPVCPAAKDAP